MQRFLALLVVAVLASPAGAQTQSSDQAACLSAMTKGATKLAKTQGKAETGCLKSAAREPSVDFDACVVADPKQKVTGASERITEDAAKRCTAAPDFGYRGPDGVIEGAILETRQLTADFFGAPADPGVATDDSAAKCQSKARKAADKVVQTILSEYARCEKTALRAGSIASAFDFGVCLQVVADDDRAKLAKAQLKLFRAVNLGCPDPPTTFSGPCGGAADVATCLAAASSCRSCLLLSVAKGEWMACDAFDNGEADGSCTDPIAPTTTTTSTTSTTTTLTVTTSTTTTTATVTTTTTTTTTSTTTTSTTTTSTTLPAVCGNGSVEGTEQCDDGNEISGDCCSASCTFESLGAACAADANACTDDVCDGAGACTHPANTAPCDDGAFCNGADTCSGGACVVHAGNPCASGAECAATCNEAADHCLAPAGATCSDDGNVCTDDECNGAGACAHPANTAACDDGEFCNGADTCAAGVCSGHAGDPCSGGASCNDVCNEGTDNCVAANGSACDDGVFCNGADTCSAGACTAHAGDPCPGADGDADCAESCSEGTDTCTAADSTGAACDDGLYCTGADTCDGAGSCVGAGDPCVGGGECANACDEQGPTCLNPLGASCSTDGDALTRDVCDGGGVCLHVAGPGIDPAVGVSGLRAIMTNAASALGNIDGAEAAIDASALPGDGRGVFPEADFGSSSGHFPVGAKDAYPGSPGDDFAFEVTGVIDVPSAGDYVVGVNSDDGFRLRIGTDLPVVSEFTGVTGGSNTAAVVSFTTPGLYPFRLVQFQQGGDRFVEMYAKPGSALAFDGNERLVGDTANGGLPVHASGGMLFRQVFASGQVASLAAAEAVLGGSGAASEWSEAVADVNFMDGGTEGRYAPSTQFPGGPGDDFAIEVTGSVFIPSAGLWTFGASVDEGAQLSLGGVDVFSLDGTAALPREAFGTLDIPTPGLYPFRLVAFDDSSGAGLEFFAARGAHAAFDAAQFRLLGDVAAGGLPVFLTGSAVIQTKKVLILGLDGTRPDALQNASTPAFDAIIADGSRSYIAQTGDETWSGPGWSTILTGVWRDKHGVSDNSFSGSNYGNFPDMFTLMKQHSPMLQAASGVNWAPINDNIVAGANVEATDLNDNGVRDFIIGRLNNHNDDVLFAAFNDPDGAGHACCFGATDGDYLDAIEGTDAKIANIMAALNARPGVISGEEDWLVLSTTDHGGTGFGHGDDIPEHRTIYFIASGESAKQGGGDIFPVPNQTDVAATVMQHLGIPVDPTWELDGRPSGFPVVTLLDTNLLYNGDAELSTGYNGAVNDGGNGGNTINAGVAGWTDIDDLTVVLYGASGFIAGGDPGPPSRGTNFFCGGQDDTDTKITQILDVTDLAGQIDASGIDFDLSGWLGGFGSQNDQMTLTAVFQNSSGTTLSQASVGPVTNADRGNVTSLLLRQTSGGLPVGTRRILVELRSIGSSGSVNDGYADNLSLTLSASGGP